MGKYVWNYHFPSGLFVVVSLQNTVHCYRAMLQNNATEQCYRAMLQSIATEVQSIVLLSNTTELCYTAMPQ